MFFKKRRAARALKKNKDIIGLVDWQKERSKELDAKFIEAEGIKDPAEKILKLNELVSAADRARWGASYRRSNIVDRRTGKKVVVAGSAGGLTGAAAFAVPGIILFPPLLIGVGAAAVIGTVTGMLSTEGRITRKNEKRLNKNPDVKGFGGKIAAQEARAQEMLNETAQSCSLDEVSRSPRFKEAFDVCEPLRERFGNAAADAAKQAFEVKTAPPAPADQPRKQPGSYKLPCIK